MSPIMFLILCYSLSQECDSIAQPRVLQNESRSLGDGPS